MDIQQGIAIAIMLASGAYLLRQAYRAVVKGEPLCGACSACNAPVEEKTESAQRETAEALKPRKS